MTSPRPSTLWQQYRDAIRKHALAIVACTGGAVILAVLYAQFATPIYESQVRVLVQNLGLALDGRAEKSYDKEFLSTQAELIRSPLVVTGALQQLPPSEQLAEADDPVSDIIERVRVNPLANTDIMKVSIQDADADRATNRLRSIIESYQRQLRSTEQHVSGESLELFARREEKVRRELEELQKQRASMRSESPLVGDASESVAVESVAIKDLSDRMAETRTRRAQLEAFVTIFESSDESTESLESLPLSETLSRSLSDLNRDVITAQTERDAARAVFGDRHPERLAAEQRVKLLEGELERQRRQAAGDLRHQLEMARVEEAALDRRYAEERARLKGVDEYLLAEQHTLASVQRLEQLHALTLASLQDVQLQDQALAHGRSSIFIQVLDDYLVPEEPLWPRMVPLTAVAGILALLLSLTGVILVERLPLPALPVTSLGTGGSRPQPMPSAITFDESANSESVRDHQLLLQQIRDLENTIKQMPSSAPPERRSQSVNS